MEAIFLNPIETIINNQRYSIQSNDDLFFVTRKDFFGDGVMVLMDEALNLDKTPEYPEERQVISFIKNKLKQAKKINTSITNESLGTLGEFNGTTNDYYRVDNRLKTILSILIKRGIQKNQFINQAIMEKLERDGLLNQEGDI